MNPLSFTIWRKSSRSWSERRPAVVRMGLANGTSDEFTGTDDGTTDANGLHPEAWNPVLNAAHPTTTVKFTVVDGEQDVGQFLRIRPVPGSAKAIVAVKIDGRLVTALRASGSEDAFAYINATYLTKGDHTITFTRMDGGSGDFAIDAFQLSGSWRIGSTKDTYGGMVHETSHPYQYKTPRRFPLTDGNMDHFARGLSGGPNGDNGTHIIPFDVPADILEEIGDATLSLAFNGGSTTAISVQINDAEAEELDVTDTSGSLVCSIPVANLVAGENTLLHQPEYRDPDKAHRLMSYLSGGGYILPPGEAMGSGSEVRVLIGPENVAEELKDSSVIIASYDAGDNTRGLIGVVGPTRMDYSAIAAKLSFLAEGLSKRLGGSSAPPEGLHNKLIIKGDDLNDRGR